VVAGRDRHLEVRQLGRTVADGEHDALVGRHVVIALRDEQPGLAQALGIELLDDDLVEQRAEDVGHRSTIARDPSPGAMRARTQAPGHAMRCQTRPRVETMAARTGS